MPNILKPTKYSVFLTLGYCFIYGLIVLIIETCGLFYFGDNATVSNIISQFLIGLISYPVFWGYIYCLFTQTFSFKGVFHQNWKIVAMCYVFFELPVNGLMILQQLFKYFFPSVWGVQVLLFIGVLYIKVIECLIVVSVVNLYYKQSIFQYIIIANKMLKNNIGKVILIEFSYFLAQFPSALFSIALQSLNHEYDIVLNNILVFPFMYGVGLVALPAYYMTYRKLSENYLKTNKASKQTIKSER